MQTEELFFSIIIPAHNEEKYIQETLKNIQDLEYPKEKFEVIVIENGSSDNTLVLAERYEGGNIAVLSSPTKGVSVAKNLGIDRMRKDSDWTIFLDADTILKKNFLVELNAFLKKNKRKNYSVGTTEIRPIPDSATARAWFFFYDLGHRMTKASYSLKMVRSDLLTSTMRFDENIAFGEDVTMIKESLKHGNFFFLQTKSVFTSTRRFDSEGWWKIFFSWIFVAVLPPAWKRRFTYKVVR